uniref:DUF4332 domain-containing protein n=1 Tax=Candidatus Vondammii sp. HM_W22 TaxID=2687299 RepID=UPI002E7BFB0D|nr:DUF4332 domain-containing protein [Candidatus Vondammii sp. HM_W22]
MEMAKLVETQGIGKKYSAKLEEAGIGSQDQLLEVGADPKGRESLGEATCISGKLLLGWANRADLARVRGLVRGMPICSNW